MYIAARCILLSGIQTIHMFVIVLAVGGRKEGEYESLDSYLTLSALLMTPKLDCQKLRCCLSEYFFVESSLFTKTMSQNHLKIEQF